MPASQALTTVALAQLSGVELFGNLEITHMDGTDNFVPALPVVVWYILTYKFLVVDNKISSIIQIVIAIPGYNKQLNLFHKSAVTYSD